jgi:hypothetical protein
MWGLTLQGVMSKGHAQAQNSRIGACCHDLKVRFARIAAVHGGSGCLAHSIVAVDWKVGVEFRLPNAEMMSYNGATWWTLGPLSGPADGPSAQPDI